MNDKMLVINGLGAFNTSADGVLKVVDGKVVLDKKKAYNRARRFANAGCNTFRILRRGIWSVTEQFDWTDDGYWPVLREYVELLGSFNCTVIIEIFDSCADGDWFYADYVKAKKLIRTMFVYLGNLPYVEFGVGNELNKPESRAFVREVVYPEFKAAHKAPFTYGASICHPGNPGPVEWQKYEAEKAWDEKTALAIYRPIHGVMDETSDDLIVSVDNWIKSPICVIWSVDGVFKGDSPDDRVMYNGKWQARPSAAQIKRAMAYWISKVKNFTLQSGQVKYGFEYIGKVVNNDDVVAAGITAISEAYYDKWKEWPKNYGKHPLDYVDPTPPVEPPPVTPPNPPNPPNSGVKITWQGWLGIGLIAVAIIVAAIIIF